MSATAAIAILAMAIALFAKRLRLRYTQQITQEEMIELGSCVRAVHEQQRDDSPFNRDDNADDDNDEIDLNDELDSGSTTHVKRAFSVSDTDVETSFSYRDEQSAERSCSPPWFACARSSTPLSNANRSRPDACRSNVDRVNRLIEEIHSEDDPDETIVFRAPVQPASASAVIELKLLRSGNEF